MIKNATIIFTIILNILIFGQNNGNLIGTVTDAKTGEVKPTPK